MQCGIVKRDRDSLRVLWFKDNDIDNDIVEYRFKRLPYGLNCSMSVADYCLRKTADDNIVGVSAAAIEAVKSGFYVDDGLISCKDADEGQKCVNEIIALLQSGGFDLRKFVSENNEILSDIDADRLLNCNKPKDVSNDQLHECKVLGMQWNHHEKTLFPKVNLKIKSETKRGLWATIAQVFDPIRICAPYLLPGRKLLQEVCAAVKEWDSPISLDLLKRWYKWVSGLPYLESLVQSRSTPTSGSPQSKRKSPCAQVISL